MMSDGLECVTCVHTQVYTRVLQVVVYMCYIRTCTQFTNSKQGGDEELERESDIHRQKTTMVHIHVCMCTRCMCTEYGSTICFFILKVLDS